MEETNIQQPALQLRTNRGLAKYFFLGLITCGIYDLVCMTHVANDVNKVASPHDNNHTMHYCLIAFVFSWLTFGIVPLIWNHRICNRIHTESIRRGIPCSFSSSTWWGWGFFGSLLFGIGPLIYIHKLMKAMNEMNADYNQKG